jgi:hypothetical protein
MPLQQILPTWLALNGCNDTSASGFQDLRTLQPVNAGGLNLGDYFDVTNAEAKSLQYSTNGVLFAGRYRRVQVDSGATAANVKTGTIGLMPSLAAIAIDGYPANTPSANVVTSYDQSLALTSQVRPVIFLNTVTPGNFCFVQELGVATVLYKPTLTNATPLPGDVIVSAATGVADDPTQSTTLTYALQKLIIGAAIDIPFNGKLGRILLNLPVMQE